MEAFLTHVVPLLPKFTKYGIDQSAKTCTHLMFSAIFNILARYALTSKFFSFDLGSSLLADLALFLSGILWHIVIQHYVGEGHKYGPIETQQQLIRLAIVSGVYLVLGLVYATLFAFSIGVRGCIILLCVLFLLKMIKGHYPSVSLMTLFLRATSRAAYATNAIMGGAAVFYSVLGIVQYLAPDFALQLAEFGARELDFSRSLNVCMSFGLLYYCGCAVIAAGCNAVALFAEKREHFPDFWAAFVANAELADAPPPYPDLGIDNSAVFEDRPPPYAETGPTVSGWDVLTEDKERSRLRIRINNQNDLD